MNHIRLIAATAFLISAFLTPTVQAQEPVPLGPEFQVNTATTGSQESPDIAQDSVGNFVVTWTDSTNVDRDIRAALFASDGSPIGEDFVVNTATADNQLRPAVARSDAGFVIVWNGPPDFDIHARRFDPDGNPIGSSFAVSSSLNYQYAADVAIDQDGAFIVAWIDAAVQDVFGQRFASDGSPVGADFKVNTNPTGYLYRSAVEFSGDEGGFIVVWDSNSPEDSEGVSGRRFSSDGTAVGDEFLINTYTTGTQQAVDLAVGETGEFMAVWHSVGSPGDDDSLSVQGRLFTSAGDPIGDQFQINSYTTSPQGNPRIAVGAGGDYLLTWRGAVNGDFLGISGQILDSSGVPRGEQLQFNTETSGNQTLPSIATDETGNFVVAWHSNLSAGTDTDSNSIQARRYQIPGDLGDFVWLDANADGIQDGDEAGVEGVTVTLFEADGAEVDQTQTDSAGAYLFRGIPEDDYYLDFTAPAGHVFTVRDAGADDAFDSDASSSGSTVVFNFNGADDLDRDAGLVPTATTIGNRVWLDDGDGLKNGAEPGVENVTVNLYDVSSGLVDTMQTDALGFYEFTAEPGEYYLEFELPADHAFAPRDQGFDDAIDSDAFALNGATSKFTLVAGVDDPTRDAGIEPATIGNRVWFDANGDGRQHPNEVGAAGVTVRLLDASNAVIDSTVTDADGVYGFLGVATGEYRVEVILPAGTTFSPQDVGDDEFIDSDVDTSTGRTELFAYEAGAASRFYDAGLIVDPSFVFGDGFESGTTAAWSSVVP